MLDDDQIRKMDERIQQIRGLLSHRKLWLEGAPLELRERFRRDEKQYIDEAYRQMSFEEKETMAAIEGTLVDVIDEQLLKSVVGGGRAFPRIVLWSEIVRQNSQ